MGMYRTVTALLPCRRCAVPFACEVQFKTDDDYELPHYDEGEPIADLEPNSTYEGITDSLCPNCSIERATDIIAAYRNSLISLVDEGDLVVDGLGDRPRAAETLTIAFAALASSARPRRTGDIAVFPGGPPLPQVGMSWKSESVWPLPESHNPWTAFDTPFWHLLSRLVSERVALKDWREEDRFGRDVDVILDEQRRIKAVVRAGA